MLGLDRDPEALRRGAALAHSHGGRLTLIEGRFGDMERLIAPRFRRYADHLLSHIVGYESWGIPAVARPRGWHVGG